MVDKYKLVEFDKNNKSLIEILKKYSKINCRNELDTGYISASLAKTDVGFYFYNNDKPLAFICVQVMREERLHIILICSVQNTDKLGSRLLNIISEYAQREKYKSITLECDNKLEKFYKKFGFFTLF